MELIAEFGSASWSGQTQRLAGLAAALLIVGALHLTIFWLIEAGMRRARSDGTVYALRQLRWPTFWLALAIAATTIIRSLVFPEEMESLWRGIAGFVVPAFWGWMAIGTIRVVRYWVERRADISVADNLRARRRRTRLGILSRIAVFIVVFITIGMMLLSIPSIRSVGITLMASAGLAGLAVGAAAQPALKNLIAGIQLAFTEPIRIDDVVIIDGEWGRIEEIRLTYVVVALWDERRLVVPVSRFLESAFQNWTRNTSQILGTVFLQVDPDADVPRIRAKLEELLPSNPRWDGRLGILQVTDMKAEAVELRALVSAADASKAFDLRCEVREALIAFLRDEMPEALPKRRNLVDWPEASAPSG